MQRILIIDNNTNACNGLSEILTEEGYIVDVAPTAKAALTLDCSNYNVLITDQNLKDSTGLELANTLAAINPNLEIVIMTSYQIHGWQSHPDYIWLTKPLEVDLLLNSLKPTNPSFENSIDKEHEDRCVHSERRLQRN